MAVGTQVYLLGLEICVRNARKRVGDKEASKEGPRGAVADWSHPQDASQRRLLRRLTSRHVFYPPSQSLVGSLLRTLR